MEIAEGGIVEAYTDIDSEFIRILDTGLSGPVFAILSIDGCSELARIPLDQLSDTVKKNSVIEGLERHALRESTAESVMRC